MAAEHRRAIQELADEEERLKREEEARNEEEERLKREEQAIHTEAEAEAAAKTVTDVAQIYDEGSGTFKQAEQDFSEFY